MINFHQIINVTVTPLDTPTPDFYLEVILEHVFMILLAVFKPCSINLAHKKHNKYTNMESTMGLTEYP